MQLSAINGNLNELKVRGQNFIKQYGVIWLFLIVIQLAVYTYLVTTIIFTNHSFPHVFLTDVFSYKTPVEGRWFADLIIMIQGASGVQSLQMEVAVVLQALNGILFALFVGLKGRLRIAFAGSLFCFYPAFLDYYAFSCDHITFVFGDTMAILGAIFLIKSRNKNYYLFYSVTLFFFTISAYGPKIALIAFLISVVFLKIILSENKSTNAPTFWKNIFILFLKMFVTFFLAVFMFYISSKLVITEQNGSVHLNRFSEMVSEVFHSYYWIKFYFMDKTGLVGVFKLVPALLVCLGILTLLWEAYRKKGLVALIVCLIVVLLLPILLRLSYIVNNNSHENSGRILFVNGYFLVFFIVYGLINKWSQMIVIPFASILLYFFVIRASQENNAAAFKTQYDLNYINRIISRVEPLINSNNNSTIGLVVIGNYPSFNRDRFIPYTTWPIQSQFSGKSFEYFRQVDILNFFIGKSTFRKPTNTEVQLAISKANDKPTWPAMESVFALDSTVVIKFEEYQKGVTTTLSEVSQ